MSGARFNADYTGAPHEWRRVGTWVDWICDRCGCSFHGSDTLGCGRSQQELDAQRPNDRMTVFQYGLDEYTERTCDEWVEWRRGPYGFGVRAP